MRKYEVLRFISSLTVIFAWIIIIIGWLLGYILGEAFKDISRFVFFIAIGPGLVSTILGFSMIAAAQVYMVLLDIRNDTHSQLVIMHRLLERFEDEGKEE